MRLELLIVPSQAYWSYCKLSGSYLISNIKSFKSSNNSGHIKPLITIQPSALTSRLHVTKHTPNWYRCLNPCPRPNVLFLYSSAFSQFLFFFLNHCFLPFSPVVYCFPSFHSRPPSRLYHRAVSHASCLFTWLSDECQGSTKVAMPTEGAQVFILIWGPQ